MKRRQLKGINSKLDFRRGMDPIFLNRTLWLEYLCCVKLHFWFYNNKSHHLVTWKHLNEKLSVSHCLSRPDLPDYPVPPVPAHAACNYAKSHDYVPGNAHPSPPVEHEYHSIDVNYKRVTYATEEPPAADRVNGSMRPPADYKYVCLWFA